MASTDFSDVVGQLTSADCLHRVTTGTTKPNGGGNFCRVGHSLTNTPGIVAAYTTKAGFSPMASGCKITGAICRFTGGGESDFSVFLFAGLQSTNAASNAYLLGIDASGRLSLRKGALNVGLPDEAPLGANTVLRRGTAIIPLDTWVHLQLEVVCQPFGDVYLNCLASDLDTIPVTDPPVWDEIPGMELDYNGQDVSFIDDVLGINSGTVPLIGGRAGHGGRVDDAARIFGADSLTIARQTAP